MHGAPVHSGEGPGRVGGPGGTRRKRPVAILIKCFAAIAAAAAVFAARAQQPVAAWWGRQLPGQVLPSGVARAETQAERGVGVGGRPFCSSRSCCRGGAAQW